MSLRLSGHRVLCPVLSCGAEVGYMDGRALVLAPGYHRSESNVFRMRRWRAGDTPRHYNPNDPISADIAGKSPCCLPVKVQCWSRRCRRSTADADADALGADPRTHDGDEHHDRTVIVPRVRVIRPPGPPQRRRTAPH